LLSHDMIFHFAPKFNTSSLWSHLPDPMAFTQFFSYSEVLCIMTFHFVIATSQSIVFICLVFSIQLFFITWYKVYHLLFIISLYQSIIFKTFCWEGLILECDSFATSAGYEEVYRGKRDFSLGPKTGSNFCK
jgi:hypothetical protein